MLGRNSHKAAEKHIGDELHESFDHLRSAAAMAAEQAAARIAPAVESAKESMAPRIERAREAANQAWETRMKAAEETTADLSRRARRKAEKASRKAEKLGRETTRRTRAAKESLQGGDPGRSRRWRWMLGALAAGAAVGAVTALISRRRASDWEEYEAGAGSGPSAVPTTPAGKWSDTGQPPPPGEESMTEHSSPGVSKDVPVGEAAKRRVGEAAETARRKAGEAMEVVREKTATAKKRLAAEAPTSDPTVPPRPVRDPRPATTSRNDGTPGAGPRH